MSILASLVRAYDRLPVAPPFGYSLEKISFCISLNDDGTVAHVIDLRDTSKKKPSPRMMLVPTSFKRPGISPKPFFLWDNTAFALGVSANPDKDCSSRHHAFRDFHLGSLKDLNAQFGPFCRFLEAWEPAAFSELGLNQGLLDQNVVFALEEHRQDGFLHETAAAKEVWAQLQMPAGEVVTGRCLVSGKRSSLARLHPAIKGVWGGQVAGGSIVSFNLDAFESYEHTQGFNAPVSEQAAFAYTTALNRFLAPDSGHRLQIGDASTVFWADAANAEVAEQAESLFLNFMDPADSNAEDAAASKTVGIQLERIRQGEPLSNVEPQLAEGVRFFVLGLAPNAARLSVRFYFEDSFGRLTRNYQKFLSDMAIEPSPRGGFPPLWRYLRETAVLGKRENIAPSLAGEWMRSILSGGHYPLTLLNAVRIRIRADGEVNALRVSILKAVVQRNFKREAPVALDPDNTNRGYLLGRLFATYEQAQAAALGSKVNATIKDKFYGSASAQPRKVFHMLESGSANHLSKVGKVSPGRKVNLEKQIAAIMDLMEPGNDPFPASLSAEEQALFGLGYYHQRNDFFKKHTDDKAPEAGAGEAAE